MSSLELSAILIPALFAGLVAILATVVIERGGGALGGIITLPTTIVPASIGIWEGVSGIEPFTSAMSMVPIGMLLNVLFLGSWRILPKIMETKMNATNLVFSVSIISIFIWAFFAGISTFLVETISDDIGPSMIGLLATSLAVIIGVSAVKTNPPAPPGINKVGPTTLFVRGLAAGSAIAASVWIAGLGLPFISGMVSVFPAIFLTTMVSLWISQGADVPVGATGPMMLGSASVSIYALLCIPFFATLGPWWGSLVSWALAVGLYSLPAGFWIWRTLDDGLKGASG